MIWRSAISPPRILWLRWNHTQANTYAPVSTPLPPTSSIPTCPDTPDIAAILRRLPVRRVRELLSTNRLLNSCHRTTSTRGGAWKLPARGLLKTLFAECRDEEDRAELAAALTLIGRELDRGHRTCDTCLNFRAQCICGVVPRSEFAHRVWLYQHAEEYRQLRNSGKLVVLVCRDEARCRRVIAGVAEQETPMFDAVRAEPGRTVVLYPRKGEALSVADFRRGQIRSMTSGETSPQLNIIVPDGTTKQAKENVRRLTRLAAPVSCAHLGDATEKSWIAPFHYVSDGQQYCTAQAVAIALRQLGDDDSYRALETATQCLFAVRDNPVG